MKNQSYLWWKGREYRQISKIGWGLGDDDLSAVGSGWMHDANFTICCIGGITPTDPIDGLYISVIGEEVPSYMKTSSNMLIGKIG